MVAFHSMIAPSGVPFFIFVNPSRLELSFFLRNFGIESFTQAIRAAIDEAMESMKLDEKRVILFNLSGHGHFDLTDYNAYNSGKLTNNDFPEHAINDIESHLPKVNIPVLG